MIISPKYKFVFIAPEKTGTTSIHGVLEKIEDDNLMFNCGFYNMSPECFIEYFGETGK